MCSGALEVLSASAQRVHFRVRYTLPATAAVQEVHEEYELTPQHVRVTANTVPASPKVYIHATAIEKKTK